MNSIIERPESEGAIQVALGRYKMIGPFCQGKRILDYGCGYGYGSALLQQYGHVIGVDFNKEVVEEAGRRYPSVRFGTTDIVTPDLLREIDIVCSLECIEHLEKEDLYKFLQTISAYVPEFAGSTPDGDMFPYKPATAAERYGFHVCHYTHEELIALFRQFYRIVEIYGGAFDPNPRVARYTSHLFYAKK